MNNDNSNKTDTESPDHFISSINSSHSSNEAGKEKNSVKQMLKMYKSLFQGLSYLNERNHIKIDTSVCPIIHPSGRIPLAPRGNLKTTFEIAK